MMMPSLRTGQCTKAAFKQDWLVSIIKVHYVQGSPHEAMVIKPEDMGSNMACVEQVEL
jgi:hypothetical protein